MGNSSHESFLERLKRLNGTPLPWSPADKSRQQDGQLQGEISLDVDLGNLTNEGPRNKVSRAARSGDVSAEVGFSSEVLRDGDSKINNISTLGDPLIEEDVLELLPLEDMENGGFGEVHQKLPAQRPALNVLERGFPAVST